MLLWTLILNLSSHSTKADSPPPSVHFSGAQNARYRDNSGAIDREKKLFGAPAAHQLLDSVPPMKGNDFVISTWNGGNVEGSDDDIAVMENSCSSFAGFHCVEYYQCIDGLINKDGSNLFDIRKNFNKLDPTKSKCPENMQVIFH